jgi:hypothetical protein
MVAELLKDHGYRLDLNFDAPIPSGESESVVLDVSDSSSLPGAHAPTTDQINRAIEQAVLWYLESMSQDAG